MKILNSRYFDLQNCFKNETTPKRRVECFELELIHFGTGCSCIGKEVHRHTKNLMLFRKPGQDSFTIGNFKCTLIWFEVEDAELYVELSSGENAERSKFTVSAEMFFELGFSVNFTGEQELSREKYEEIAAFSERHSAVKRGLSILSFGDNTKKGLAGKLRTKGFSRESAEYAAEYLAEAGYINEAESAVMLARDMAEKKLYGARRIAAALLEKGFSKEAIDAAADETDVDFAEICAKRISKMGGRELFAEKATKQKTVAALLRYGFSNDDIKEALKMR